MPIQSFDDSFIDHHLCDECGVEWKCKDSGCEDPYEFLCDVCAGRPVDKAEAFMWAKVNEGFEDGR